MITSGLIQRRLTIGNCCAVQKGIDYISQLESGKKANQKSFDDIETLLALLDNMEDYAQFVAQATYTFTVTASVSGATTLITINGYDLGILYATSNSTSTHAKEIKDFINSTGLYDASFTSSNVTITGINGALSNNYVVSVVGSGGNTFSLPSPAKLTGGIDIIDLPTAITKAQMNNILDRICKYCDSPCTNYVSFSRSLIDDGGGFDSGFDEGLDI